MDVGFVFPTSSMLQQQLVSRGCQPLGSQQSNVALSPLRTDRTKLWVTSARSSSRALISPLPWYASLKSEGEDTQACLGKLHAGPKDDSP